MSRPKWSRSAHWFARIERYPLTAELTLWRFHGGCEMSWSVEVVDRGTGRVLGILNDIPSAGIEQRAKAWESVAVAAKRRAEKAADALLTKHLERIGTARGGK